MSTNEAHIRQAILAISVACGACDGGADKVKSEASTKDAVTIQKAADEFYKANGTCPKTAELTLPREFAARGAVDSWGNAFEVVCAGSDVKVISAGSDGRKGTADDIKSK